MTYYNIPQGRCPVPHHLQGMAQNAEKKSQQQQQQTHFMVII